MKRTLTTVATVCLLGILLAIPNRQTTSAGILATQAEPPVHSTSASGSTSGALPVAAPAGTAEQARAALSCAAALGGAAGLGGTCSHPVRGEDTFDIAVSPDGRRAYVANRSTDNLFVIDLIAEQFVDAIDLYPEAKHPLGPGPERLALTPDGGRLLVANVHDDSLTVIDTATHSVVKTLAVGVHPTDVAVSPHGSVAYVSNATGTVTVVDMATLTVRTTVDVTGGGTPFAVTFAPDGRRAYVAATDNGPVYVLDPATHTVTDTIAVSGTGWTGDLVVSPDGATGYLSALEGNEVIVLDLASGSVRDTFAVVNPEGLALSADGRRLYVGTFGFSGESAYNVWMLDTQSGALLAGTNLVHPGAPRLGSSDIQGLALAPNGKTLYVPTIDGEAVFLVDAATLEQRGILLTNPIPTFGPLRGAISPDGAYLYAASWVWQPVRVSVVDVQDERVVGEIVAGPGLACDSPSWDLDVTPDGRILYVLCSNNRSVLVADTASRSFVGEIQVPASPSSWLTSIAVHTDGDRAYVLDHAGTVHVIDLATQAEMTTIETTQDCSLLKLSPDGKRGYVICNADWTVLDLATNTALKTLAVESGGGFFEWLYYVGIRPDSSQYVVGTFFNLYVYDAATDTQVRAIAVGAAEPTLLTTGQDFAFSPDGQRGYLALPDENAIGVFDAKTWQMTALVDTGRAPWFGTEPVWLLMAPDGSALHIVNELSDNVLTMDTATHQLTGVVSLRKCLTHLPLVLGNYQ